MADEGLIGSISLNRASSLLWRSGQSGYEHVWPEMEFGSRIVLGTIFAFFGAACGSIGGVGGGGVFVPMLTLLIGFDQKSATAVSKCMIMGAAGSTVYYNLKLRHPTLDLPVIDYNLALLIQPMLMLGISIGVISNVIFPEWLVAVLLILLLLGATTKSFFMAIQTWKRENIKLQNTANLSDPSDIARYRPLPAGPDDNETKKLEVPALQNIYWKELGLLSFVWLAFLVLQIARNYTTTCSTSFWVLNLLQVPVSFGVFLYEAVGLYKGVRKISSQEEEQVLSWNVSRLVVICVCCVMGGIVAGMLGLGGGFLMGPMFLQLGMPPQVSSATATFAMTFSSSMSVVEYYLLKRFPVPYAVYFTAVAVVGAFVGQHIINKLIALTGRASLIVFVLVFSIFTSCILLVLSFTWYLKTFSLESNDTYVEHYASSPGKVVWSERHSGRNSNHEITLRCSFARSVKNGVNRTARRGHVNQATCTRTVGGPDFMSSITRLSRASAMGPSLPAKETKTKKLSYLWR